ncbi:MAG: PEP-CTERM sorting domain-containing protein [Planctomycetes bacterium]|nr:PEP-CTERM sorting domain-containing protein [Planctomycetota bacterium]
MLGSIRRRTAQSFLAALTACCLPLAAQAGTINIILSDADIVYSGANFGGSIYDVVGHPGGNLIPAEADNIKTAVFELDMASVGTIMTGDVPYGQMYGDLKIDNVGASLNSLPGSNFHVGIGNNGGGFGFDWFTTGGQTLRLGIDEIDLLISSGVLFFTGSATVLSQNLPFGLAFDTSLPVVFSYTATLPGLLGPANARTGAMASGALTVSGVMVPEPATYALLCSGLAALAIGIIRRPRLAALAIVPLRRG